MEQNLYDARAFLNELAKAARVERIDYRQLDVEDTFHYANGYLKALLDFSVFTPEDCAILREQVSQWPAPLASDGSLWSQPWVTHGTKPLFVKTIDLSVLTQKPPVLHTYDCDACGNHSQFYRAPEQGEVHSTCDECGDAVLARVAVVPPVAS